MVLQAVDRLSRREREVLALVAAGLSNKEIAQALTPPVAVNTVKGYVRDILGKLAVPNRAAAAAVWAAPPKWMDPKGCLLNKVLWRRGAT